MAEAAAGTAVEVEGAVVVEGAAATTTTTIGATAAPRDMGRSRTTMVSPTSARRPLATTAMWL